MTQAENGLSRCHNVTYRIISSILENFFYYLPEETKAPSSDEFVFSQYLLIYLKLMDILYIELFFLNITRSLSKILITWS